MDFLGLIGTVADSFKNERFFSLYLQQISRNNAGNMDRNRVGMSDGKPAFLKARFQVFKMAMLQENRIEINQSFKMSRKQHRKMA